MYVLSRTGLTGEQESLPPELPDRIRHLQGATDLPIAVGFGISHDRHVREVVNVADAAISMGALVVLLDISRSMHTTPGMR